MTIHSTQREAAQTTLIVATDLTQRSAIVSFATITLKLPSSPNGLPLQRSTTRIGGGWTVENNSAVDINARNPLAATMTYPTSGPDGAKACNKACRLYGKVDKVISKC
jgi:hypothetical protein